MTSRAEQTRPAPRSRGRRGSTRNESNSDGRAIAAAIRSRAALPAGWCVEHGRIAAAEHRLELAELRRLEPARRVEPVAEAGELARRHRLQHVDLGDDHLEDRQHPPQRVHDRRRVPVLEQLLGAAELVEELLEPQLVDLVDDDEQHLVVLVRPRALGAEHLVEGQVAGVGQRGVAAGAGSVTAGRW